MHTRHAPDVRGLRATPVSRGRSYAARKLCSNTCTLLNHTSKVFEQWYKWGAKSELPAAHERAADGIGSCRPWSGTSHIFCTVEIQHPAHDLGPLGVGQRQLGEHGERIGEGLVGAVLRLARGSLRGSRADSLC